MSETILEMRGICKTFPGVRANHNVNIDLQRGEVLALLGENGAGKSVLMSILHGFYQPDEGEIWLEGEKVSFSSPRSAIEHGIGMIHQHFMLIPVFTALENIVMGLDMDKAPKLELGKYRQEVQAITEHYGLEIDLDRKIADMSVGEQQRVEIVKALYRKTKILILDEPTAVLTPKESRDLFEVIRRFKADGKSIIFISHKMDELMEFSDRITVLRRGEVITTFRTADTSIRELAATMVGRDVQFVSNTHEGGGGRKRVEIQGLCAVDHRGVEVVKNVSLDLFSGEILAIAGIDGNGQNELSEVLMGVRPPTAGKLLFDGEEFTNDTVKQRQARGFGYVPPDRKEQGLVLDYSIEQNLILDENQQPRFSRGGLLRHKAIAQYAREMIQTFDIRPANKDIRTKNLSGGNQQKVIVARVFSRQPQFLVAVNPIRGIDISATEFIHQQLLRLRSQGASIMLISTDLEEVFAISDRIAVICHGEIVGVRNTASTTTEEVGLMMTGVRGE